MERTPQPKQLDMFAPRGVYFDGETYDPAHDEKRLEKLLGRVWSFMSDRCWHTLSEIRAACGGSEASVSARLRDLRKERFGAYTINRKRIERGLWAYRMTKQG